MLTTLTKYGERSELRQEKAVADEGGEDGGLFPRQQEKATASTRIRVSSERVSPLRLPSCDKKIRQLGNKHPSPTRHNGREKGVGWVVESPRKSST